MGFFKEFKEFAMKGNVMDMAVGVIIGGAFGKIVTSLVDDVLMPFIGMLTGGIDLSGLEYKMMLPAVDGGEPIAGATLKYGAFIQNIIDFLIIAFCIFLMIKAMNKMTAKKEEEPAPAPEPSAEEKLLGEIRDLLKNK
ncbi:MAG: large-conductance mechanosensitive channel protein MscL [Prevotella sp.]|nr:large-conductance mechanosensitive channel protein MscL [Prevotella sp.]MBP5509058.1 large-conductance mechanosensitive channel protein MscL [Prevotella sp.]